MRAIGNGDAGSMNMIGSHGRSSRNAGGLYQRSRRLVPIGASKGVPNSLTLGEPFATAHLITAISTLLVEADAHKAREGYEFAFAALTATTPPVRRTDGSNSSIHIAGFPTAASFPLV